MAEELCADVRRVILQRMSAMEDMCLVVMVATGSSFYSREHCATLFYVTRNMRDPPHHVRFHFWGDSGPDRSPVSYLLRTPKALRQMVDDAIRGNIVMSFYLQGADGPMARELNWDPRFDDFDPEHRAYVTARMPIYHCYAERNRVREEVFQRIVALVSEN